MLQFISYGSINQHGRSDYCLKFGVQLTISEKIGIAETGYKMKVYCNGAELYFSGFESNSVYNVQGETLLSRNFYALLNVLYTEQEEDGSASA